MYISVWSPQSYEEAWNEGDEDEMEEMSRITRPESSEEIRLHLAISDENQNTLKEAENMDLDAAKHDLENGNTHGHGEYSISHEFYVHSNILNV